RPSSDRAATGPRPRRRRPERARAAPGAPAGGAAAGATAKRDQPRSGRRGDGLTAMGWSGTGAPVRRLARWGLTLGVALCVALVVRQGVGNVAAAVAGVGSGILAILLLHLAQVAADGMGWRAVLAGEPRPPAGLFVWGRWIAESVNDLLPVMGVGGNVVRARALAGAGVPGPTAGASVLVDITVIMMTQLPVTLLGLGLLVAYFDAGALVGRVLLGVLVPGSMLAG